MPWRRVLALLLSLLLLVSGSGAATLCVEADGTARVELVSALCCEPGPDDHARTEALAPAPPCAGCDDRPLEDGQWARPAAPDLVVHAPAPVTGPAGLLPPFDRAGAAAGQGEPGPDPPRPRALRPATLRC